MRLPQPELWVIDWVLCGQGEAASGQKIEDLMRWRDLRERVWRAQLLAQLVSKPPNLADAEIDLTPAESEELLAIVPTTFRWGTGEDVGMNLKVRIAQELWGDELREKHDADEAVRRLLNPDPPAAPVAAETNVQEDPNAGSPDHQPDEVAHQNEASAAYGAGD